jgi:hypothetical protein
MASRLRYLGWYRPNITGAVVRATLTSAVLTCAGMTLVGLALWSHRVDGPLRPLVLALGALGTLGGPISLMYRLARMVVSDDVFLGLTPVGVDVRLGAHEQFFSWDEVQRAALVDGIIEIQLAGGPPLRIDHDFDGVSRAEVVRELERVRQRVLLGLERGT